MPIVIRQATKSDAEAISLINKATWFETYGNDAYGITREYFDSSPSDHDSKEAFVLRKWIEIESSPGSYFMAFDNDRAVGYASGKLHSDKSYNEFASIYILSEYQWKGVWRFLSDAVFRFLGNEKDVIVEVVWYNKKAIGFYERLWFSFLQELPEFEIVDGIYVPEIRMIRVR